MGEEEESEEAMMARMMGFSALGTTHGKHVGGNHEMGAASIVKPRTWRQYMNRCARRRCVGAGPALMSRRADEVVSIDLSTRSERTDAHRAPQAL